MMRLTSLRPYLFRRNTMHVNARRCSSFSKKDLLDEAALEEEAERRFGWILKTMFMASAGYVSYQFFPYLGDGLVEQSISLLRVQDPLFKRMGASRLSRFAVDDERRMKVIEMGGGQGLLKMLEGSKDDKTRKQALRALLAIARSDSATEALHEAGALPVVQSAPLSEEDAEIGYYKSHLLQRFHDLKYDGNSTDEVVKDHLYFS